MVVHLLEEVGGEGEAGGVAEDGIDAAMGAGGSLVRMDPVLDGGGRVGGEAVKAGAELAGVDFCLMVSAMFVGEDMRWGDLCWRCHN